MLEGVYCDLEIDRKFDIENMFLIVSFYRPR